MDNTFINSVDFVDAVGCLFYGDQPLKVSKHPLHLPLHYCYTVAHTCSHIMSFPSRLFPWSRSHETKE